MAGNKHDVEKAKAVIDAITSVYHHELTHPGVVRRPFDAQRSLQQYSLQCAAYSLAQSQGANRRSTSSRTPASFATAFRCTYLLCGAAAEASVCDRRGYDSLVGRASLGTRMCASLGLGLPLLIRRAAAANGRSYLMV